MTLDRSPSLSPEQRLQRLSGWFIAFIIIVAALVLAGWQWGIALFRRPLPNLPAMNPTTALAFLLTALSFGGLAHSGRRPLVRVPALLLAFVVLFIGVSRLAGLFIPALSGVDQIIFAGRLAAEPPGSPPSRMALNTAFCFVLGGIALLGLWENPSRKSWSANIPEFIIGGISLLAILGYVYRVKEFYGLLQYLPMSLHTAACFLLLSLALLFIRPDRGIIKDFMSNNTGSVTARRLIPFAFVVPILLGWLRLLGGWTGLFTLEFGVSALVLSIIVCFVGIVWYNARLLNKRDRQRKTIEAELRETERRFRHLIGSIRDYAIFMVDPSGKIVSWNQGAQAIKGYTSEEAIGQHISIFYTPEEIERGLPGFNLEKAARDGHYHHAGWRVRKDGSRFWADIVFTAIYDDDHRLQGFAKVTRDLTEQKRAEEKIAYQARLMEDSTDAVFSIDNSYRIITWNKAAESLYGYSAVEMIGTSSTNLLQDPADKGRNSERRRELIEKGYWKGEVQHLRKTGSSLTLLLSASAIRDPEGKTEGYVIVCRDITERKKAEEQLRKFNEDLTGQVNEKTAELASVLERLSEGFMELEKDGQISYVNRMAAEMNRCEVGDLVGRNFWQLFPSSVDNEFGAHFRQAMIRQENRHFEMFSPSIKLWIDCALYPGPNGISFFFRDITEQWNARETISRSNNELRALASHLQDIREEERAGMAREIHDELGQQLTGLKMDMSWVAQKITASETENIRERVQGALELLDTTIKTVRRIATELRPSILDDLGLLAAMEWQSQEFEKRSGIQTCFHPSMAEMDCSSAMSIGLFRICQEALTNVARHSGARRVDISLDKNEKEIVLQIADDGRGLDPQKSKSGPVKSLGLLGMKERALMMGGKVDIRSEQGQGLTLTVTVPLADAGT